MLFWIIIFVIALLSGLALIAPMWRPAEPGETGSEDVALYRAQLSEVERDLARGVLNADEAERTRTEIARRLLAADQAAGEEMGSGRRNGQRAFDAEPRCECGGAGGDDRPRLWCLFLAWRI